MKFIKLKVIGPHVVTINVDDISSITDEKIYLRGTARHYTLLKKEDRERLEQAMIDLGNGNGCFAEILDEDESGSN